MSVVTNNNFLTNKFSRSQTNKILRILNTFVDPSTTPSNFVQLLPEQASQYMWAVGEKPAYHIQYQVDSVGILRIKNFIAIVWKPKYIEYPQMIQFPSLKEKKIQSLNLQFIEQSTRISQTVQKDLRQFIQKFYGTFFHSDTDFQTNLVTFTKHYLSKKTSMSYWHCVYDNFNSLYLHKQKDLECIVKIRVTGCKQGYNKCLLAFSKKGERQSILMSLTNKWTQTLSFLAMVVIFISIVSCQGDQTQGMCQYRDQAMVGGAGLMMALFGMKFAKRSAKKKPVSKNKDS